jgi:hypothetical protein
LPFIILVSDTDRRLVRQPQLRPLAMANKEFDPYREALVIETSTVWPEEMADLDRPTRERLAQRLHAEPDKAAQLSYERLHTGFARVITVTAEDLARVK